jgi:hypothetical protein
MRFAQEATMFRLAVLGPIVTGGLGVARQCVDCYRSRSSYGEVQCFGFGSGCIEQRPNARDGADGSSRITAQEPRRR